MAEQLSLLKNEVEYGGDHSHGKAKVRRPLSTRKPIHVTLRSRKAIGVRSLYRYQAQIQEVLEKQSERWGVRVYRSSINSNHIHLVMRGTTRLGIQNFFRTFAGLTARLATRAEKGNPFGKFWDKTIWTRVAEWGQAFKALENYVVRNILESRGIIPYDRRILTAQVLRL